MPKSVIFLSGAPEAENLSYPSGDLPDSFLPAFKVLLGDKTVVNCATPISSATFAAWRAISFENHRIQEDVENGHGGSSNVLLANDKNNDLGFLSIQNADDTDFLEHSFAVSEDPAAAIEASFDGDAQSINGLASFVSDVSSSFNTANTFFSALSQADLIAHQCPSHAELIYLLGRLAVTNIRDLPSARELLRLYPQTVTPNLLAAVISISPPRSVTIRPRRTGQEERTMEIVELILGDHTAAGFTTTFWLPLVSTLSLRKEESQAQQRMAAEANALRLQLSKLRRGDIVMLTNVALSTFRGKVYGQSLRRRGGLVWTDVKLVPVDLDTNIAEPEGLENFKKVRNWMVNFVGIETEKSKPKKAVS